MNIVPQEMYWRWELTPAELFAGFHPIKSEPAKGLPLEVRPFSCEKKPLDIPGFYYQVALSEKSVAEEVIRLRDAQPELPLSGDRRSGVILFDGDAIVGALVIQGNLVNQGYKLFVHPKYRKRGLGLQVLVEWCWLTKRQRVLPRQGITLASTKALLSAHKTVVERALEQRRAVPERVLSAIASGEDADRIIREATRIEQLVLPPKKASRVGGRHA